MYRVYQMHRGKKVPLVAIHKGQEETAEFFTQEEAQEAESTQEILKKVPLKIYIGKYYARLIFFK